MASIWKRLPITTRFFLFLKYRFEYLHCLAFLSPCLLLVVTVSKCGSTQQKQKLSNLPHIGDAQIRESLKRSCHFSTTDHRKNSLAGIIWDISQSPKVNSWVWEGQPRKISFSFFQSICNIDNSLLIFRGGRVASGDIKSSPTVWATCTSAGKTSYCPDYDRLQNLCRPHRSRGSGGRHSTRESDSGE